MTGPIPIWTDGIQGKTYPSMGLALLDGRLLYFEYDGQENELEARNYIFYDMSVDEWRTLLWDLTLYPEDIETKNPVGQYDDLTQEWREYASD